MEAVLFGRASSEYFGARRAGENDNAQGPYLLDFIKKDIEETNRKKLKIHSNPLMSGASNPSHVELLILISNFLGRDDAHIAGALEIGLNIVGRPDLNGMYDKRKVIADNFARATMIASWANASKVTGSKKAINSIVNSAAENTTWFVLEMAGDVAKQSCLTNEINSVENTWAETFSVAAKRNPVRSANHLLGLLPKTVRDSAFRSKVITSAIKLAPSLADMDSILARKILDCAGALVYKGSSQESIIKETKSSLPPECILPSAHSVHSFKSWYDKCALL